MNAELQKAIDCLHIRDVYQRNTNCQLMDGFDPKYSQESDNLDVEFKHFVTQSEVLEVKSEAEGIELKIFRVHIDLGARWVASIDVTTKKTNDNDGEINEGEDNSDVKAVIEATFLAEYVLDDNPGKAALDAFALQNASYHVWPYWREYLSSQCLRMNLPKIVLPIVQFAANHNETSSIETDSTES